MTVNPAAYVFLLLSLRSCGKTSTVLASKSAKKSDEAIAPALRASPPDMTARRHKKVLATAGKSGKASGGGKSSSSSFSMGHLATFGAAVLGKSGKADKASKGFDGGAAAFLDVAHDAPTIWPTYHPSPPTTVPPSATVPPSPLPPLTPHIVAPTRCDPIGTRPVNLTPVPVNLTPVPFMQRPTRMDPLPRPSPRPSPPPETPSSVTFRRGDLTKDIARFGIKVNKGVTVRMVARANKKVSRENKGKSKLRFHSTPEGGVIIPLESGYVYVSNAKVEGGKGGVYGMYFDDDDNVVDYKMLLTGTSRNRPGGSTPWGTFVSCEKSGCWQLDPDPSGAHHSKPEITKLGGNRNNYVACDDRNPSQPIFFVTVDHKSGALGRYIPRPVFPVANWDSLHARGGKTEYLVFLDDRKFIWSANKERGRVSQQNHYPMAEGVSFSGGLLYFVSKRNLYVLDLDKGTYRTSSTSDYFLYNGEFKHAPDQLVRNDGEFLYFTESGGGTPGVYSIDAAGQSYAIFEAYDSKYFNDKTTGLAFSPDGTRMYACFQDCGCKVPGKNDCGCLLVFRRDDGLSFDGMTMGIKFRSLKTEEAV